MKQREILNWPFCDVPNCNSLADNNGDDTPKRRNWAKKEYHPCKGYVCSRHNKASYNHNKFIEESKNQLVCFNGDGRAGFPCPCNGKVSHRRMLETDHMDGNPNNNKIENIQILCACCHSYKTDLKKDHLTSKEGKPLERNRKPMLKKVAVLF